LSFIEFNYMVLQAYDFLELSRRYDCRLQMGGSDQWGNIVAGVDLIRRMEQRSAFGITFPLITTSSGEKMGKTARGAVWLDPARTSPYEYFQYWINTDDRDVVRFLALFTFLPLEDILTVARMEGGALNTAKAVLAFEATQLVTAVKKRCWRFRQRSGFSAAATSPADILPSSSLPRGAAEVDAAAVPSSTIRLQQLKVGIPAFRLFHKAGLAATGAAARRLIDQGGAYVNGNALIPMTG